MCCNLHPHYDAIFLNESTADLPHMDRSVSGNIYEKKIDSKKQA